MILQVNAGGIPFTMIVDFAIRPAMVIVSTCRAYCKVEEVERVWPNKIHNYRPVLKQW